MAAKDKPKDLKIRGATLKDGRLDWPSKALVAALEAGLELGDAGTVALSDLGAKAYLNPLELRGAICELAEHGLITLDGDSVDCAKAGRAEIKLTVPGSIDQQGKDR